LLGEYVLPQSQDLWMEMEILPWLVWRLLEENWINQTHKVMKIHSFCLGHSLREVFACEEPRSPSGLKVKSASFPVNVEDLATKVQPIDLL